MADVRRAELNGWLRNHHGVITSRRLREIGLAPSSIHQLMVREHLRTMWRGVYVSSAVDVGRLQVMTAICQQYPSAAIAFTTAGREWGFRGMADTRVHVLVPHATTPDMPDEVVLHRCRRIDPVDVALPRRDGIVLTSPPRTLFDCAAFLDLDSAASAVEQAIAESRCTMPTLMSTLVRLQHPNRPGSRAFEAVLQSRPVLRGAARSELERSVREAARSAGLPPPEMNMPVRLTSGDWVKIDLAWPEFMVAVEVDHPFWHDREAESARDKRRDRKLATMGWLPQRLSQVDVERRLDEAIQDLAEVLVVRGWTRSAA